MKMTKRIFITLLILAVTVSALAVSAYAAEPTGYDFGYVLEYFEEPTLFDYDFTKDVDYSSSLMVKRPLKLTDTLVRDDNDPAAGHLALSVGSSESFTNAYGDNNVYFNWNSADAIDDFIIKMTVAGSKGEGSESSLPIIVVAVGDEECTDASAGASVGATIVAIDYKANCIRYIDKDTESDISVPFALNADAWYSVSIAYSADSGMAAVVVADTEGSSVSVENAYVPYSAIKNVRIGTHGTYYGTPRGTVTKFQNICAFGGKYDRDPSTKQSVVEDTLVEMYEAFGASDITVAEQGAICEIVTKIAGYGFTTDDEEVASILAELSKGVVPFYNDKLVYCIDTIASLGTYAEKRALVDNSLAYAAALETVGFDGYEELGDIQGNIDSVKAFDNALKISEEQTLAFIEAAERIGTVDLYDYVSLQEHYDVLSVYSVDPTYEGVKSCYDLFLDVKTSLESIRTKSQRFISAVTVANDTALDFNTRAEAFTTAKNAYYDNASYPGITEAVAIYDSISAYMNAEIEKADNFIKYVDRANYADYVTAKQEFIDEAKKYIDCQPEYKGVAEAKALMVEVQAFVDTQIKNANAYIDAVSSLDYLRGDAYIAALQKAQELQKSGNVLGVAGVAEANIKLNKILSSSELEDKYVDYFIGLVDAIDKTTDYKALFELLVDAKDAESFANPRAEGVFEASTKLEKAIEDYNKKVNSANTAFETANELAINTCAIGKNVNPVADRVVAIVKKFFEEE